MRNHEILERHENEESCGQGISRHRASCHCGHFESELSSLTSPTKVAGTLRVPSAIARFAEEFGERHMECAYYFDFCRTRHHFFTFESFVFFVVNNPG